MKITVITVSAPAIKNLMIANESISSQYPSALDLHLYYGISDISFEQAEEMIHCMKSSHLVFLDLMGSPSSVVEAVYKALDGYKGNVIPYGNSAREHLRLGDFTGESMRNSGQQGMRPDMANMGKIMGMAEKMGKEMPKSMKDVKNYSAIMKYFKVADKFNVLNMLYLILREYGGIGNMPEPSEPRTVEGAALSHPKEMKFYDSFEEYQKDFPFDKDRPTVALLFYGHTYPTDTSFCIDEIKIRLEEFANVLPIAVSGPFSENKEKIKKLLFSSVENPVDIVLNFMSFRLGAGPTGGNHIEGIELLNELNVPYLHPYFMSRRTIKEWEASIQGSSTSETMISVMLPELDGCIETYPIGAMSELQYHEAFNIATVELELIEERVERLIARVKKQILLRKKKNKEKRIAIICYNYPPGEANLLGGAFLDTFSSIENILLHLKNEGYEVTPLSKEELMAIFTAGKAVNSGKYGDEWSDMIKYASKEYSKEIKKNSDLQEMKLQWGDAPGRIMTNEKNEFLIPGTINGNIFIGLQPSRGIHEENDKVYHDKELLPHHQYIAFYQWLREEFCADAIIHVGTHGTLEFLKGKECGMSGSCYPDKLLGDMPHMYLYYCGNPSEATIAKRRSHANLIGYQAPVFVPGELYGEYAGLMEMVGNYRQSLALSPQSSGDILKDIYKIAEKLNLPKDFDSIESELYRMNRSLIPKGLHVFGKGFNDEEAREYIRGLLRYSNKEITALRSLVAVAKGHDLEQLLDQSAYDSVQEIDMLSDAIFDHYMNTNELLQCEFITKGNREQFMDTLEYGRKLWMNAKNNEEIKGLIKTLSGEYNPAKLAGDIYRNPEILPAGYNLYQFDPRLIPTTTAYQRGKRICENTLKNYKDENGAYPVSTAVVLWGIETSRTQGETFSQILSYLGVRISKGRNEWDPQYEIIPICELGRPRIDVTINICGFFRDMFPNLIESMADLFVKLFELDESDEENYFKANAKGLYRKLVDEGYDHGEARELAVARIFGPKEGGYGTGITKLFQTKNWESEEQIGTMFIQNVQHIYTKRLHGKKVEGLYEENLKSVEFVSQVRSSHEYEVTDLDHYYEYFGGLAKSVEMAKGKKVRIYITDTTGERVLTESVEKSIGRGVRTRALNPKWIDGMLAHKYHGVQKIAERFENIMGLAATTNSVEEWIYNDLHRCYVEDENLSKKMQENNPYAYMNILEQMMEYNARGYWNATQEQLDKLKQVYLDLEDSIEEKL